MLEMKITVHGVDITNLAVAITNLADAIAAKTAPSISYTQVGDSNKQISNAESVKPSTPTPAPIAAAPAAETNAAPAQPVPVVPATAAPTAPTVPNPVPVAPAAAVSAPAAPEIPTSAPQYTLDMIAAAGSALIDAGKMDQLLQLLGKFGVASLTDLAPEHYGAMATELRALGARI